MPDAAFCELLRKGRHAAGYSQEALAERAGLSVAAIAALEQGTRRAPYRDTVAALAAALNMSEADRQLFEASAARARRRHRRGSSELPTSLTSFIERNEVRELQALIDRHRLLTITGSGGAGKTRTAVEVARRSEYLYDETLFLDLLPVSNGKLVAAQLSLRLNVRVEGQDGLAAISRYLSSRHRLLVIDNCEHVRDDAALVIATLLRECANLTILTTSRETLGITGEVAYRLPPMDGTSARELFIARARALDATWSVDPQRLVMIDEICRNLNGIPLAIELAASHVSTLGIATLRRQVRDGLALKGPRDLHLRHQAMSATIAWSYDLLTDLEALLFRRLSVFAAGFTLEVAEEVCSGEPFAGSVGEQLAQLVRKSLIDVEHAGTSTHYRFLDSIRAFASERLSSSGELKAIMLRFVERLERQAAAIDAFPSVKHLLDHRVDMDNIGAVVRWAQSTANHPTILAAAHIVIGFRQVFYAHGLGQEAYALAFSLLENLDEGNEPEVVGRVLHAASSSASGSELLAVAARGIPLLEKTGHRARAAYLHVRCAETELERGNPAAAEHHVARAESLMEGAAVSSPNESVSIAVTGAYVFMLLHDYASARAALERLKIEPGDPYEVEISLMLAEVEFDDGNLERALELTKPWRLELDRYPNAEYLTITVLGRLTKYLLASGNAAAAEAALRESLAYALDTQDKRVAFIYGELAQYTTIVSALAGRTQLAARILGSSETEYKQSAIRPTDAFASSLIGALIGEQLDDDSIKALQQRGAGEELPDLFGEFLAQPAAASNARLSAVSRPRATSVTRSSPN